MFIINLIEEYKILQVLLTCNLLKIRFFFCIQSVFINEPTPHLHLRGSFRLLEIQSSSSLISDKLASACLNSLNISSL